MPCEKPDRNARPMQDLNDFAAKLDDATNADSRRRLQELARAIPQGYGSGAAYADQLLVVEHAQKTLQTAEELAADLRHHYHQHLAFTHEERDLLSSLGLTANLFRPDSQ